ncbi:SLC13 family permease [Desulfosporosinus meridiei]|uniref:Na+/H+ antiporter NhaD-like permease n=1 Tax=Desulfosporosinus meridiei (strain ATCC BAA-275 / DSM 13257 / KCTC 12902 / NCIMB 13706 / S10) TaxID=768704 RepID=J7IU29_DESMD|nr:ArsB/NhaD family transporter [Desulfosporosinus meridiei]AFQ43674.1 Na+/H+ antiporter NhaD-like permease [Desulfosporosinus meridiei DSM 13257]
MEGNSQVLFATAVFLISYAIIISEKIHRTAVALAGGMLVIIGGVISQEQAIEAIDFNTIGLLVGMMVIVGIARNSGLFEYLAVWAAKKSKGDPIKIMISLTVITAMLSALLDNVTTVLLIVPITFSIAKALEINPMPILFSEIMASNIGGTATLIGDPPNIMIGSATGLGFMDFVINVGPVILIIMPVTILILKLIYRKQLITREELKENIMRMDPSSEIKDVRLLKKSLIVIALTILGFFLHQYLHLESATVALSGAALLLLITNEDPEHALIAVEWPVIFFFAGLFILVGALEHVGVIEWIAMESLKLTGGEMLPTGMLILWLSAFASSFVDNIPFVATMIPLIEDMGRLGGMTDLNPLWWALSLGACLGGNGTIIGASANVVVVGMAEKRGYKWTFVGFMKVAFPLMIVSILISSIYLYFFYLT